MFCTCLEFKSIMLNFFDLHPYHYLSASILLLIKFTANQKPRFTFCCTSIAVSIIAKYMFFNCFSTTTKGINKIEPGIALLWYQEAFHRRD